MAENNENLENVKENKKGNSVFLIILAIALVAACVVALYFFVFKDQTKNKDKKVSETPVEKVEGDYRLSGNGLEAFDLAFMKLNNYEENSVYSPLSIKYALFMLADGANGDTQKEILDVIGDYNPNIYVNSSNLSLANSMFVRDSFKNKVNSDYITNINKKYNAEIIYDSFENANTINNWVSDKTFNLLDNVIDDSTVRGLDFVLVNALAIDMEWVNLLSRSFVVYFAHEDYIQYIDDVNNYGYEKIAFEDGKEYAGVKVGAAINNYDIVSELGEENIRKEVGDAFDEYYSGFKGEDKPDKEKFLDQYIKSINANYGYSNSSTDFRLYQDEKVTAFAKDLKEDNGTQFEYVAIMPNEVSLKDYINDIKASDLTTIINNLKEISSDNFEQGYVTKIEGYIPMFKYEYSLSLLDNLRTLGISKVFTDSADLTNLAEEASIKAIIHKANIEFSNEGIKASAATVAGGLGAAGGEFEYKFKVPVKEINIDFDKPYLYLIRNKKNGEVWFAGKVYEPCVYEGYSESHIES